MIWPYAPGTGTRTAPARLDGWLPAGSIMLERHTIEVAAGPLATLTALDGVRWRELPIVQALFALRGLPREGTVRQFFATAPFVMLEEAPGREVVVGVLGPFWRRPEPGSRRALARTPADFRRAVGDGMMAAIAAYGVEPTRAGTLLWTETWLSARAVAQRAAFLAYWLPIGPFSAWIRRMMLRAAAHRAALDGGARAG